MNRTLAVSLLLLAALAIGFATNNSTSAPPGSFFGPRVVAKVSLTNQTAAIPTTTIFTPAQTGLYRVSVVTVMTTPGTDGNLWNVMFNWTDDAGAEQTWLAQLFDYSTPPNDYPVNGYTQNPWTFRANAGTPVQYWVYGAASGTYDLFLVVERLD